MVDGERNEGVLNIAGNTNALPIMDISISGALMTQFTMAMVLRREVQLSWLPKSQV